MFLFDSNEKRNTLKKQKRNRTKNAEAKALAKQKKIQQDDMDALQITFYEIESWIEKTTPVLSRMTKELDRVSRHFKKPEKRNIPEQPAVQPQIDTSLLDLSSMKWSLSFQSNNSMRLETNIKSVEQLIEAVQKIKLLADQKQQDEVTTPIPDLVSPSREEEAEETDSSNSSTCSIVSDPSIEYWNIAMYRRPHTCLEKYKHCNMNLSRLTEDVSPSTLSYICQVYWDCLHPKFSADWNSFWNRSDDPERNQVCVDSGLAMVFLHIIRHNRSACVNAHSIAYYYYDRAREALMDFFDSPDLATIETLLNLSLFCVLCKRHSQSRIYLSLAYRMIHQLSIGKKSQLPLGRLQRKRLLKLHMVAYYNDITVSVYSGEPPIIDEAIYDIDFYEIIQLNKEIMEHKEANYDKKTIAKETFFVHLLELARIGKKIQAVTQDYQRQNLQYHHNGTLPLRWVKKVQELEISLATWFDRLPVFYRVDPKPNSYHPVSDKTTLDANRLQEQAGLLLMIQYQTQWIMLHKTFLSPNFNKHLNASSSSSLFESAIKDPCVSPYRAVRSYHICTDAANRIVLLSEIITECFDWCVCQQFISCVYQSSTVFCKSILNKDDNYIASKSMVHRIMSVLAASKVNYQGLPDDLTACLNEFLAENNLDGEDPSSSIDILDQLFRKEENTPHRTVVFNDTMFNSPHMHESCLNQTVVSKHPLTMNKESLTSEALFTIKLQNPTTVTPLDLEPNTNWRCKFSSSNIAQINHRVM